LPAWASISIGGKTAGTLAEAVLVGRYVTPDLIAAVAEEHNKGRRLLVVTTNLDSQAWASISIGGKTAGTLAEAVSTSRKRSRALGWPLAAMSTARW
jgi:hypothetical protein